MSHFKQLSPIPRHEISEVHVWRDWFTFLRTFFNIMWFSFQRERESDSVTSNTTLDTEYGTIYVTVSGKTITLPPASTDIIGESWTIILATIGWVDITVSGSDTIVLPVVDDTIRLDVKGSSITLRCLTATSWGIV